MAKWNHGVVLDTFFFCKYIFWRTYDQTGKNGEKERRKEDRENGKKKGKRREREVVLPLRRKKIEWKRFNIEVPLLG